MNPLEVRLKQTSEMEGRGRLKQISENFGQLGRSTLSSQEVPHPTDGGGELDLHQSGNELSLELHQSGNELSLDLHKSCNELSLD